jgi:hypothetical protein
MQFRVGRGFAAVGAIAIAVVLLIISMAAPIISTSTDFSIFNSGWNGTSKLAILTYKAGKFVPDFQVKSTGTEITITQLGIDKINLDPATSALVVIGPGKTFTSSEGEIVGGFVRDGGQLLLADDFGTGNSLLAGMGATSRFSNDLVMDLSFEKQPEFSVVYDLRNDSTTRNVSTLLLNYPSSLSIGGDTELIASSSIASWLDTNGDRLQEWGEPRGPFPIAAREHLGTGTILLLSDPSVLINGMAAQMDNGIFGANLIDEVCNGRTAVFFDESHRTFFDPITVTMQITGPVSSNAKVMIAVLAFFLTLWIFTDVIDRTVAWTVRRMKVLLNIVSKALGLRISRKETPLPLMPMSKEELLEESMQEHPEWRIGLVRYLLRERERHGKMLERK